MNFDYSNDPCYHVHEGLVVSIQVLSVNSNIRKFLEKLISFNLEDKKNKPKVKVIKGAWYNFKYHVEDNKNMSIGLIKSHVGMLNMILFTIRQLALTNCIPFNFGEHFLKFINKIQELHFFGNDVDFKSVWSCIYNFIPCLASSLSGLLFDDNSFKTVCSMWFKNIYDDNQLAFNYLGTIVCTQQFPNKSSSDFQKWIRDSINSQVHSRHRQNSKTIALLDDSILTVSIRFQSTESSTEEQQTYAFPLVIKLDVPYVPQSNQFDLVFATYKLVGVYYRTSDSESIMAAIAAKDSYGRDFKFDWSDTMPQEGGGIEHNILEIPANDDEDIIKSSSNIDQTFLTKVNKGGKVYFADGLIYVLSPSQGSLFKDETGVVDFKYSKIINRDIINNCGVNNPIRLSHILILRSNAWINDEIINFFAFKIQEKFPSIKNYVVSSFFCTYMRENTWSGKTDERYLKSLKFLKKMDKLFDDDSILHIPFNVSNTHWIYLYVCFKTKKILSCDSSNGSTYAINEIYRKVVKVSGMEYSSRYENEIFDICQWKQENFPVAKQVDGFNCGIFTILNMYRMMRNVFHSQRMEINHERNYSAVEKSNIRHTLIEICCMRLELEVLDCYVD